jgi:two-component system response regulator MprA
MITKDKKRVLIIEDDESLKNILRDKLNYENFSVLTAKNGEEGLKIAIKTQPDIILLDILMPKMNGVQMLKKLREDSDWGKRAKILLLTNDTDPEHMSEALKNDAIDYLVKSDWNLESVVNIVKKKKKNA